MQPPKKPSTPKENFFDDGRKLLKDSENSTNPKLAKLRAKAGKRYLEAHLKGGARISTGTALAFGLPVLLVLAGVCIYAGIKLSTGVFWLVLIASVTFAILIMLMLLALAGLMRDTQVSKVMLGMFDKIIRAFSRSNGTK